MNTGGLALLKSAVVLGAVALVVGCNQQLKTISSKKSDGVIVRTKAKDFNEIQSLFPANKVTVISKEDGLFKIKDAELKDVKEKLPTSYSEEDRIINVLDPKFDVTERSSLEGKRSVSDKIKSLGCIKGHGLNQPSIKLVSKTHFLTNNTVEVGSDDIVLQGSVGSSDSEEDLPFLKKKPTPQGNVQLHWVVEPPAGSNTQKESDDSQMSITPDRAGGYLIALIEQNTETKECDLTGVMVGATWNKPYEGSHGNPGSYSGSKFFQDPIVKADEAWKMAQGEGITIAVIDSGINYNHPDLSENIKINEKEIPDNGIDDDGNGLVDDVYGWDFALGDKYPFDDESHGTHVSGLAAAENFGIAKKAKILPIKAILPTGGATASSLISAIYYAIQQKADIINLSLGGDGNASPILLAAVKKAQKAGILIVAAAGNSSEDADKVPTHFTAADGSNILSVAATDENDQLTDYSNYGVRNVELAAPGGTLENPLLSTYAFTDLGRYVGMPGTSMATPIVSGAAAVVKSVDPSLTAEEIKEILMESGRSVGSLQGKIKSGKILDVAAAVRAAHKHAQFLTTQN